jgi:hypothetical protein
LFKFLKEMKVATTALSGSATLRIAHDLHPTAPAYAKAHSINRPPPPKKKGESITPRRCGRAQTNPSSIDRPPNKKQAIISVETKRISKSNLKQRVRVLLHGTMSKSEGYVSYTTNPQTGSRESAKEDAVFKDS